MILLRLGDVYVIDGPDGPQRFRLVDVKFSDVSTVVHDCGAGWDCSIKATEATCIWKSEGAPLSPPAQPDPPTIAEERTHGN